MRNTSPARNQGKIRCMKLALLFFPAILWGGGFIDGVYPPERLAPGGFAEIDGFGFDGTAKVTVGGLDAAVYPWGNYTSGGEVVLFIQIPSGVPVGRDHSASHAREGCHSLAGDHRPRGAPIRLYLHASVLSRQLSANLSHRASSSRRRICAMELRPG